MLNSSRYCRHVACHIQLSTPLSSLPLQGESWSEVVARPILFGWQEYGSISVFLSAFFFITFVLVNTFILFNVFVAVLIEKMVQPEKEEGAEPEVETDTEQPSPGVHTADVSKMSPREILESVRHEQDMLLQDQAVLKQDVRFIIRQLERIQRHMDIEMESPPPPPTPPNEKRVAP
jgi:hypothetical protein